MPRDYEVGYGKPPRHSRFKKGRSGNPKGRPKGAKNLKTELEEELQEKIVVREGKTRKVVSKQRAMLKSLTAKAVQADPRASALVIDMIYRLLHADAPESPGREPSDDDLDILRNFAARILGANPSRVAAGDPAQGSPQPGDEGAEG